jgi:hypothetical protein
LSLLYLAQRSPCVVWRNSSPSRNADLAPSSLVRIFIKRLLYTLRSNNVHNHTMCWQFSSFSLGHLEATSGLDMGHHEMHACRNIMGECSAGVKRAQLHRIYENYEIFNQIARPFHFARMTGREVTTYRFSTSHPALNARVDTAQLGIIRQTQISYLGITYQKVGY